MGAFALEPSSRLEAGSVWEHKGHLRTHSREGPLYVALRASNDGVQVRKKS
jgi:hypothetical protein